MTLAAACSARRIGLSPVVLTLLLVCPGCVATQPAAVGAEAEVRVTRAGQPFEQGDGAAGRTAADAQCGEPGVRATMYDRFDAATGAWVYPGGCA